MKTAEERISTTQVRLGLLQKIRRLILEYLDSLSLPNINQHRYLNPTLYFLSKFPNSDKSKFRHLVTRLYPSTTLSGTPLSLDIFIYAAQKDLALLELSITGALQSSINKVNSLTVVAPSIIEFDVGEVLRRFPLELDLRFLSDEDLLSKFELADFNFIRPNIKMEILKIVSALNCESEAALLIDGDTVLLRPRNWITHQQQIVLVAQEYTPAHIRFNKKFLGLRKLSGLGFVTHHQVVRCSQIREAFFAQGQFLDFVNRFNSAATEFYMRSGEVFPSEWQLMGDLVMSRYPNQAALTSFKNLGISRKRILKFINDSENNVSSEIARLKEVVPQLASISFHEYKE